MQSNLQFDESHGKWLYTRSFHKEQAKAQQMLGEAYNCKRVLITCSGVSAIACALHGAVAGLKSEHKKRAGQEDGTSGIGGKIAIVMASEMYCDSHRLVKYMCDQDDSLVAFEFDPNPHRTTESLASVSLPDNTIGAILFAESVSNPSSFTLDGKAVKAFCARVPRSRVVIDNTWVTHVGVANPFKTLSASLVVLSLSKHYSNGRVILGAVLGSHKAMSPCETYAKAVGMHTEPSACTCIAEEMPHMDTRVRAAHQSMVELATMLSKHYSSTSTTAPCPIASLEYCEENPGTTNMLLLVSLGLQQAQEWMETAVNHDIIDYKTSFGGKKTRFDTFPIPCTSTSTYCRLAVGWEANSKQIFDEIVRSLSKFFAQ